MDLEECILVRQFVVCGYSQHCAHGIYVETVIILCFDVFVWEKIRY